MKIDASTNVTFIVNWLDRCEVKYIKSIIKIFYKKISQILKYINKKCKEYCVL
jgi:hypothetical protein